MTRRYKWLKWLCVQSLFTKYKIYTYIFLKGKTMPYSEKAIAPHSSTLACKIPWTKVGCSPWGHYNTDTTSLSLSCIGEGNGNRLQCSCLENPRDGGAWWAAVYGVAQSQTRLKRLSSSSSMPYYKNNHRIIFISMNSSKNCIWGHTIQMTLSHLNRQDANPGRRKDQ